MPRRDAFESTLCGELRRHSIRRRWASLNLLPANSWSASKYQFCPNSVPTNSCAFNRRILTSGGSRKNEAFPKFVCSRRIRGTAAEAKSLRPGPRTRGRSHDLARRRPTKREFRSERELGNQRNSDRLERDWKSPHTPESKRRIHFQAVPKRVLRAALFTADALPATARGSPVISPNSQRTARAARRTYQEISIR
jgi:hypothetical protein